MFSSYENVMRVSKSLIKDRFVAYPTAPEIGKRSG